MMRWLEGEDKTIKLSSEEDEHPLLLLLLMKTVLHENDNDKCMNVMLSREKKDWCNSWGKNNGIGNQRLGSKTRNDCLNDGSYMSHKKCFCWERVIKNILHPKCKSRWKFSISIEQRVLDAMYNNYHNNFILDVSPISIKSARYMFQIIQ